MKSSLGPRFSLTRLFPERTRKPAEKVPPVRHEKPPVAKGPAMPAKGPAMPAKPPAVSKPAKFEPHKHSIKPEPTCAVCKKQLLDEERATWPVLFFRGIRMHFVGAFTVVWSGVRLIRFVVGGAFCLVGLIGSTFRAAGLAITHPNDRVWFRRRRFRWAAQESISGTGDAAQELN